MTYRRLNALIPEVLVIFLLFNIIASLEGVYFICMLLAGNGLSGLGA